LISATFFPSYSIPKSKLTLLAQPCRTNNTVCDSPSRHF